MNASDSKPPRRADRKLGPGGIALAGFAAIVVLGGGVGAFIAGRKIKDATDGKPLPANSVVNPGPFALSPSARTALTSDAGALARVRVESLAAGELFVDGAPAGPAPRTLELAPGPHVVELRTASGREQRRLFLGPGVDVPLRFGGPPK